MKSKPALKRLKARVLFSLLFSPLLICACGPQESQYEHHSSAADLTNGALLLNSANHEHGYGKTECFNCHVPTNLHRVNRLGIPSFPYAKPLVDQAGLQACFGCHGKNGNP